MNLPHPIVQKRADKDALSLVRAMRARTRQLHTQAERSGIVSDILRGRATLGGYALFLRNLLPAYEALEEALNAQRSLIPAIARDDVFRAPALRSDLEALAGARWATALPLLDPAKDYAAAITQLSGDRPRLLAHAYVRYFGDINGGQILKGLLAKSLALQAGSLAFYDFPGVDDLTSFRLDYYQAFDAAVTERAAIDIAAEEAAEAFASNIRISEAVRAADACP